MVFQNCFSQWKFSNYTASDFKMEDKTYPNMEGKSDVRGWKWGGQLQILVRSHHFLPVHRPEQTRKKMDVDWSIPKHQKKTRDIDDGDGSSSSKTTWSLAGTQLGLPKVGLLPLEPLRMCQQLPQPPLFTINDHYSDYSPVLMINNIQ